MQKLAFVIIKDLTYGILTIGKRKRKLPSVFAYWENLQTNPTSSTEILCRSLLWGLVLGEIDERALSFL